MLPATEETAYFDSCKQELLDEHSGKFAVVCGRRLVGVHNSLDLALKAAANAFGEGDLAEGAPVLINEIGEAPRVRVIAQRTR
ncbi:MAG: hypothetical protein JXP73_06860 [Deltaproteobacteria bacterium]|jgi:hypothetical protein|nr:hypothetical protein [Deltaproteobacteria bacterium]